MAVQTVFKRFELKYLLNAEQKERVLQAMEPYMTLDGYGRTTIRNIYFDTDNYRLVRHSIEKPVYKEKLRIRSYRQAEEDSTVFVELKKKYRKVVYKRRVSLPEKEAMEWAGVNSRFRQKKLLWTTLSYFRAAVRLSLMRKCAPVKSRSMNLF